MQRKSLSMVWPVIVRFVLLLHSISKPVNLSVGEVGISLIQSYWRTQVFIWFWQIHWTVLVNGQSKFPLSFCSLLRLVLYSRPEQIIQPLCIHSHWSAVLESADNQCSSCHSFLPHMYLFFKLADSQICHHYNVFPFILKSHNLCNTCTVLTFPSS